MTLRPSPSATIHRQPLSAPLSCAPQTLDRDEAQSSDRPPCGSLADLLRAQCASRREAADQAALDESIDVLGLLFGGLNRRGV